MNSTTRLIGSLILTFFHTLFLCLGIGLAVVLVLLWVGR